MKYTPIQKAITQVSHFINNADPQTKTRGYLIAVLHELQSLLPYERECFEETYSDGFERPDNNYIDFKDYFYKIYKQ